MTYQLITIDLDGTLVDTAAEIAEAANRTLQEHGLARRPPAEISLLIGAGTRELMSRLLSRCLQLQPDLPAAAIDHEAVLSTMDRHYRDTTGTSALPYRGCVDALSRLSGAGLRLACVTNKDAASARRVLEATQLDGFFDLLIGGDSLPEKKPHASVLRHAAQRLGVAPVNVGHVGDSAIDVQAARNAGVQAWAVPYGYNGGRPIAESEPDRLFESLSEMADHVLAQRRR